jgi:hypothetical protein
MEERTLECTGVYNLTTSTFRHSSFAVVTGSVGSSALILVLQVIGGVSTRKKHQHL